jgi:tripartite-type tricarboxylate transporter receptor subunit TctC
LLAGVNIVAVQFKGGGPADIAALSGEVAATFGNISQEVEYVKSGRLRALAVTSATRNSCSAGTADRHRGRAAGLRVPYVARYPCAKGTPAPIVKLLNEQLKKILTGPGEAKLWQDRGLDVIASSPEDFRARLVNERKKWGDVIKKRGDQSRVKTHRTKR